MKLLKPVTTFSHYGIALTKLKSFKPNLSSLAAVFFALFLFSCKKQDKELQEVKTDNSISQVSSSNDLKGLSEFLSIPELDKRIKGSIAMTNYRYYSNGQTNKLWIIGLKPGSFGFAKAKLAANLKDGQFSMIIASYNYDTIAYKKRDFSTYTGTTSIYHQSLRKLWDLEYERGQLKKVKQNCFNCVYPSSLPPDYTNWCILYPPLCNPWNDGGGDMGGDPLDPITGMMNPPTDQGGGGGGSNAPVYDPNNPFADINYPQDAPPNVSTVDNGVTVEALTNYTPQTSILIGQSRRDPPNVEDMAYGTPSQYGDPTGIDPYMLWQTDDDLFIYMDNLFYWCTFFDNGMAGVAGEMIQKFRDKTGGAYSNPTLDNRINNDAKFRDYIKLFGRVLHDQLQIYNFDISQVPKINIPSRPVFNGLYNKFHGLMITINDTESTDIEFDPSDYQYLGNGKWVLTVTITIHDHFGLDKHDALKFQGNHPGFAAWWVLQHQRGYVPFETISRSTWKITIQ